jgi:hypothetical protein
MKILNYRQKKINYTEYISLSNFSKSKIKVKRTIYKQ